MVLCEKGCSLLDPNIDYSKGVVRIDGEPGVLSAGGRLIEVEREQWNGGGKKHLLKEFQSGPEEVV